MIKCKECGYAHIIPVTTDICGMAPHEGGMLEHVLLDHTSMTELLSKYFDPVDTEEGGTGS